MSGFNYLDRILDAVVRVNKTGAITYFSESGLNWLGASKPSKLLDIVHPEDHDHLSEALTLFEGNSKHELRVLRETSTSWVEITLIPMAVSSELVVCIQDISKWKNATESLIYASEHDVLTGLANRGLLEKVVNLAITNYQYLGQKFALMILDLDGFKKVNDTLGHHFGDEVLIQTATRLSKLVRTTDLVARIGGDEFVIVLTGMDDPVVIKSVASKILKTMTAVFTTSNGKDIYLSTSIGIAIHPENGNDYHSLFKNADLAMYHAKEQGKNRSVIFTLDNVPEGDLSLESSMFDGIHEGEFYLEYQPKFDTVTRKPVGCEALMRWTNPDMGKVSPANFITLAEDNGLITYLGLWSLRSACHQLKEFQSIDPSFKMSVNVSSKQFVASDFTKIVKSVLTETEINPANLVLEITETTLMLSTERTNRTLLELKELGISFSIDDFGAGFSSLSYLKKFPISELKIDKSFVNDIVTDPNDKVIVKTIINMAHSLGMTCVAEGVETTEQFDFLRESGCDVIQGYLFSKPLSVSDFLALLRTQND